MQWLVHTRARCIGWCIRPEQSCKPFLCDGTPCRTIRHICAKSRQRADDPLLRRSCGVRHERVRPLCYVSGVSACGSAPASSWRCYGTLWPIACMRPTSLSHLVLPTDRPSITHVTAHSVLCTIRTVPCVSPVIRRVPSMQMRKLPFAFLVFCCIDTAAGFRAAHIALPVQQKSARCTPLQLCTSPPARRGSNRAAHPWLAAAVVAGSVVAVPTFALASATSTGEHLHLGQKIALVFKRAPPISFCAQHAPHRGSGPALSTASGCGRHRVA